MEPLTAYRKNLGTLVDETQFLLQDFNEERYKEVRIKEKLNEACLDYCLQTQLIKEEINVWLRANVFEYDIKTRIEEDGSLRYYGFPLRIGYDGDSQPGLLPTSLLNIDYQGYSLALAKTPFKWVLSAVSPGKIQILGLPQTDGTALPSENDNLQVRYVAMPNYMSTDSDYPDTIPAFFHPNIPYKAAALLLEDGDIEDLKQADEYDAIFYEAILEQIAESYRGETHYNDFYPC